MRAVVVGQDGEPALADVPEPDGPGELVRVLACGLCGSDVEKLVPPTPAHVLGHEVVAETRRRPPRRARPSRGLRGVRALPRRPRVDLRAVRGPTIRPAGSPSGSGPGRGSTSRRTGRTGAGRWSSRSRASSAVRRRVPPGRVLIVGNGFVGRLFAAVLERRGDDVFAVDVDPGARVARRTAPSTPPSLRAAVASRPRSKRSCPAGRCSSSPTRADPGGRRLPPRADRRRDALRAPRHMPEAVALLHELDVPEPTVLPLERFAEGSICSAAATR